MISEADIWRSALAMLKRYKADAMQEAAMRADQQLEDGDPVAAATWHRIFDAAARAPRTHSLGDQARQSLTVKVLDDRFLWGRCPHFLAVSFD